jgi:hypothetical protein
MKQGHVLVSALVAALCAGVLVLFTDIEVDLVKWISCGPIAQDGERRSEICR